MSDKQTLAVEVRVVCRHCGQQFNQAPHKTDDCPAYLRGRVTELEAGLRQCSGLLSAAIKRLQRLERQERKA